MSSMYRIFLKGLLTVLPITITIYLLLWIFGSAEEIFADVLRNNLPVYVPGLGFVVFALLIFLVGLLVNNYLASSVINWLESTLTRVPFIKTIYNPLRDVMNLFARGAGGAEQRVVLVDLPGLDARVIGLVTRDSFDELPRGAIPIDHVAVFIPYSYAVGGFTILVPKNRTREVPIGPERAMQLAITAWIKSDKKKENETTI